MKLKKLWYVVCAAMTACLIQNTSAQTTNYFWSGAGDGATWDQGANWSTGIVPVNDGTTFQIYIGTGFPTPTPTPIVISSSDHIVLQDQLFGPEWGETLDIYGSVNAGFGFAPIGAVGGPKSTVNMYGTASYTSGNIFIGDPFWFAGGPNVDFNMYNSSTISTPYLVVGGHLNLYDGSTATTANLWTGTPTAGQFGGISSDATRWINVAGGELIQPTGNGTYVTNLISRGIFLVYGKKYDTNEVIIADDGTNTYVTVPALGGALQSIFLSETRSTMMVGTFQNPVALGNFPNIQSVPLTGLDAAQLGAGTIAYHSSNLNVVGVTTNGLVTAISPGTAIVSATFGAFTSTNSVLITVTPFTNSLIHRYSFSETTGTTTADSVGGSAWNGTLNGGAALGGGQVTLDGSSGYVQLPAGVVSSNDAVTIEAWANLSNATNAYNSLYYFGDQDDSFSPLGENYIGFQPFTGANPPTANALFGAGDPGYANEQDAGFSLVNGGVTNYLGNVQIVVVYHPYAGYVALYTNGVLAAINNNVSNPLATTLGTDPLNYLGQSLYGSDPFLNASIDEFRIYNGPLSAGQIAADNALGPNQLIGTNKSVRLSVSLSGGNLTIKWPTTSALVNLMSSPTLGAGAVWSPVSGALTTDGGGNYQITISMTGSAQFFRLQ